jgi:hypothetical protein
MCIGSKCKFIHNRDFYIKFKIEYVKYIRTIDFLTRERAHFISIQNIEGENYYNQQINTTKFNWDNYLNDIIGHRKYKYEQRQAEKRLHIKEIRLKEEEKRLRNRERELKEKEYKREREREDLKNRILESPKRIKNDNDNNNEFELNKYIFNIPPDNFNIDPTYLISIEQRNDYNIYVTTQPNILINGDIKKNIYNFIIESINTQIMNGYMCERKKHNHPEKYVCNIIICLNWINGKCKNVSCSNIHNYSSKEIKIYF